MIYSFFCKDCGEFFMSNDKNRTRETKKNHKFIVNPIANAWLNAINVLAQNNPVPNHL